MIAQETIDRLLDRADIVEVVTRSGVELTKAGRDYVARCPFHNEKTASFHVSPARQTWHCFGQCQEGGNAITYLMRREGVGFREAVRELGKRYGVETEEAEETAQERGERLRREALTGLNARVADFYRQQIRTPEGAAAWKYAVGRWGKEYTEEAGLGYAPPTFHALLDWAEARGENTDLLIGLGLLRRKEETGRIYDFYRGRLMIPIRDRAGRVTGFTARDLTGSEDAPKYVNSPESELYHKGASVYGIDVAAHEAARQEKFYLVEGAADAMKMQSVGVSNTVAPLGGSWTPEQLRTLRKTARNVCFINDADPVPEGKRYGAGIDYVIRNGEEALKQGLSVSVRELPNAEGNRKQDPGGFFTGAGMLDRLPEEDFVCWAAGKLFNREDTPSMQTETVRRISEMLSYITDDVRMEYVLPQVCKATKGKREMFKNLVNKARWEREKGAMQKRGEVDLRQYGFYEEKAGEGFGYWGQTEKGGDVQWSNFTMRPLFHIRDEDRPKRLFWLKNGSGREDLVEMTMGDLNSPSPFRHKIEGVGDYVWLGGDRELLRLKRYLYHQTETARLVGQMGWNARGGFYAFGNGLYTDGAFRKADDFGVVRLDGENWYIPAAAQIHRDDPVSFERERKFVHLGLQKVNAGKYLADFVQVYGDNGRVGLMYWVASLFRDVVVAHTDKFPLLNLFGPKGSGKSQMAAALMSFFVTGYKAPNIQSATPAALANEVAATCNALCHIDEYKNDIDAKRVDFLKGLYDGAGRMKMGGASYERISMTAVRTGVILSGQELPTADIALFHRCVFLSFPKSTFSAGEKARFDALRDVQRLGVTDVTLAVLDLRKRVEAAFREQYEAVTADLNGRLKGQGVETRLLENWAKILAAFRCVEGCLAWPMGYAEMLEKCGRMLAEQNRMSCTGNEVAKFWETLQYLHDTGELYEEGDYLIQERTEVRTNLTRRTFAQPTRVLYLNTSRVFTLYRMCMQRAGTKPLPEDALREYLKNASYYIGQKNTRFKVIINGLEQKASAPEPGRNNTKQAPRRALVFLYDSIAEAYGVSLETTDGGGSSADGEDGTEKQELPF